MRSQNLPHAIRRTWPVLLAGSAAVTSAPQAHAADWTKHFRVGMQITLNIEAEITGGGDFNFETRPGEYADGFVRPDQDGGDLTTFWSYQNAGQYSAADNTLTFSRAESFSGGFTESTQDDSPYLGLELAYGTAITRWGDALIGWEAGYSFLPLSIKQRGDISGSINTRLFIHDVPPGVTVPPAGHVGSPTGEGTAIERLPSDIIDGEPIDGVRGSGSRGLDASLHTLRLGPTIHFELGRRWAVQGGVGPMVGYVTGEYTFDEDFSFQDASGTRRARAEGDFGGDEFVYGGYAQALLLFHFEEHGDIYAGLQFMGLSGADFEEGARSAKLNMGATLSFLVGVNWPF